MAPSPCSTYSATTRQRLVSVVFRVSPSRLVFQIGAAADSCLSKFLKNVTAASTPEEIAKALEKNDEMRVSHESAAQEGQTAAPSATEHVIHPDHKVQINCVFRQVDNHFVAFVVVKGKLYELDGRREGPVCHGPAADLLSSAGAVCKKYMEANPQENRFGLIALAAAD